MSYGEDSAYKTPLVSHIDENDEINGSIIPRYTQTTFAQECCLEEVEEDSSLYVENAA
jgi:hypothetical protein